jgi:thioredoxin reductase
MERQYPFDVVIVGAGPAGLSAALILGRACRKVLLCDDNFPRNGASEAVYGYLTRDGIAPPDLRRAAHLELRRYPNIAHRRTHVSQAARLPDGTFEVTLEEERVTCRKLLLATGVIDELPDIPGIGSFFGKSVFQCPYCDGWEFRSAPLAVYGKAHGALEMARSLTAWTDDIALCTHGNARLSGNDRIRLARNNIRILERPITALRGVEGRLQAIEFDDGSTLARSALFFDTPSAGRAQLAQSLGCQFNRRGGVRCDQYEATDVPGVFAAGNIIKDVQLSIVAAAEGARAAFGINRSLTREDFERRASGTQYIEHPKMDSPPAQPLETRVRGEADNRTDQIEAIWQP